MKRKRIAVGKYKTVFEGELFTIKQARAIFPNGEAKIFERGYRESSVSVIAVDSKNRVLLNHEYRIREKSYLWRLPAGRVDEGYTTKEAAQKELREETGFRAKKLSLFHKSHPGQSLQYVHYIYLGQELVKDALDADEGEDIRVVKVPLKRAFQMALDWKIKNEIMAYAIIKLYLQRKKYLWKPAV